MFMTKVTLILEIHVCDTSSTYSVIETDVYYNISPYGVTETEVHDKISLHD